MKILNSGICIDPIPNGWQTAVKKASSDYRELNSSHPNFDQELIRMAKEQASDLIILQLQSPGMISKETCAKLARNSFVININGDAREITPPFMLDLGEVIQMTCFSNERDVKNCRDYGINAEFLAYGIDPLRYNKHNVIMSDIPEIVFFANHYSDHQFPLSHFRRNIVESMYSEFGDRFGVWGTGWTNARGNLNGDQLRESIIYNNSKIALSISHFNYPRYCSDRLHRAQGSGIFTISHEFTDIHKDYRVGENIETFLDISDLIKKCYYYLENSQKRQKIADAGYELAHKNYTFDNVINNIIKIYNNFKEDGV